MAKGATEAFFDAVASNESAVSEMGEGMLADIARHLVKSVRQMETYAEEWSPMA